MPEEVALKEEEALKTLGRGVLLSDPPCRGLAAVTEVSQTEAGTFQME